MLNFSLAREIYGMSPWYVDQETLPALLSILENASNFQNIEEKHNPLEIMISKSKLVSRPYGSRWNPGELENNEQFKGIGILNINGPITLSGGASSFGMEQLSEQMLKMAKDDRIISFIMIGNSGGGSAFAVETMADTIKAVDKIKPVYGVVKKGGIACSACYGIMSACRELYSEHPMNRVGSAGTMVQFEGRAANSESDGKKYKRIYASKSTAKNIEFEEALNNDNYQLIIDNLLDPMNERFLSLIKSNREQLSVTNFDNGKSIFSKDGIGTFIDGIKTLDEVIKIAENSEQSKTPASSGNNNPINSVMTVDQLKQDHPETYNAIFKQGVSQEKSRVSAWMAYADADLEKVKSGVKSGEEIKADEREELLIKSYSSNHIKNLENDSAKATPQKESGGASDKTDDEKELEAFNARVDEQLNSVQ